MEYITFADMSRRIRAHLNLSQKDLSLKLGTSQTAINFIETGRTRSGKTADSIRKLYASLFGGGEITTMTAFEEEKEAPTVEKTYIIVDETGLANEVKSFAFLEAIFAYCGAGRCLLSDDDLRKILPHMESESEVIRIANKLLDSGDEIEAIYETSRTYKEADNEQRAD